MADLASLSVLLIREWKKRPHKRLLDFQRYLRYFRRRKMHGLLALQLYYAVMSSDFQTERRFWSEPSRGKSLFWEQTVTSWNDDQLWLENFRMSKESFTYICGELEEYLKKDDTNFRKAICVEKRVAICLWHLATGEDMRSLGWRFDVAKSTACEIVNEVCKGILDVLMPYVIRWPTEREIQLIIDGFRDKYGFPQCAGAIDGTHVPIIAPSECKEHFRNRKGFYSINMQVVVDHEYRFTDIYIKWPGKVHDARVFSNSGLFLKGQQNTLFPNLTENISGVEVPVVLIGDPAYPLLPWLMKGYQDRGKLTEKQQHFNHRLSSARMVVEGALGRLKGRFRCLLKRNDTTLKYMPPKIAACCVLHNICETKGDSFNDNWYCNAPQNADDSNDQQEEIVAGEIRNAISDFLYRN